MGETGCQRTVWPLLPQEDQALGRIEVNRAKGEGAAAAAGGARAQPQQQRVQRRIVAGAGRDLVDLGQPGAR
jgi:hypothetical protein